MDVVAVGSVVMFMPALRVSKYTLCNQVTCHIMLSPNSETLAAIERCWLGSDYAFVWTDGRTGTEPKCCSISVTTNYLPAQWMRLVI